MFSRIMVALDLSPMDVTLIKYAGRFAQAVGTQKIYFLHVASDLLGESSATDEYRKLYAQDEHIKTAIEQKVKKYFPAELLGKTDIQVVEGNPLPTLLRWKRIKKIDLLMVGKKSLSKGSGVISRQFVRQSDCPVLFVPLNTTFPIKKILVPVDFSDNSGYALHSAMQLSESLGNPEILYFHLYHFVSSPETPGFNPHFNQYMSNLTKDKHIKFIKKFDLGEANLKIKILPHPEADIVEPIIRYADENDMDMIVIGAIGHSRLRLLTVGSTAEKLMLKNSTKPLLVIKQKPKTK